MSGIPWLEEMIEGVLDDGTPVKAKCWYWAKDINIEMISPYPGECNGRHIMYMCPMTFHENDLWKTRAFELAAEIVERCRWIEAHPDAVRNRRREGKRRVKIAEKHIKTLKKEKSELKRKMRKEMMDLHEYQRGLNPVNKAIWRLEAIIGEQDKSRWLSNGIVVPITCSVRTPASSKHEGMKSVSVFWRDVKLVPEKEAKDGNGWECVIMDTEIPAADFERAGLVPCAEGRASIDLAKFSDYLKDRAVDRLAEVLDAYREIAGEGDLWCAAFA